MKIIMLNYEFPPIGGGGGTANLNLLKEYAKTDGPVVDVLTSSPVPGLTVEKFAENITIYKVGIRKKNLHFWRKIEVVQWLIRARKQYRKMVNQNNYDLAHAFFGFPTGWLCRRTANTLPYIISLRGSDVPGGNRRFTLDYKLLSPLFKSIWKKASAIVACSGGLRQRGLNFLPSASIDVITNGVDTERFTPAEKSDREDRLQLITVGRLSSTKRIELLIDAVEVLRKRSVKAHLLIAGGGSLGKSLKKLISEKGLSDLIELAGMVEPEKIPQLYRKSNLFVSASMQEGMSNAMLEAMASALPIVTTRCEGVDELIADNGIVVESAEPEAIAEAIMKLTADKDLCRQMGIAARNRAEEFSWQSIAQKYLDRYKTVSQVSR